MKRSMFLISILCVLAVTICFLSTAAVAGSKGPALAIKITGSDKAQVTMLSASFGKWNNGPALWIKMKLKNVTDQPVQFKTRCTVHDLGINRGFWVPKAGKPLIKPGKEGKAKYPFPTTEMPKKITLHIQEVEGME